VAWRRRETAPPISVSDCQLTILPSAFLRPRHEVRCVRWQTCSSAAGPSSARRWGVVPNRITFDPPLQDRDDAQARLADLEAEIVRTSIGYRTIGDKVAFRPIRLRASSSSGDWRPTSKHARRREAAKTAVANIGRVPPPRAPSASLIDASAHQLCQQSRAQKYSSYTYSGSCSKPRTRA